MAPLVIFVPVARAAVIPTLMTTASPPVTIGGTISDSAALGGGTAPTGTITFNAFGPNDGSCTLTPAFTSTTVVNGNGTYGSAAFTPFAPGTYNFVASYTGDANNAAVTGVCGSANESTEVNRGAPTLTTRASAPVGVGGAISDSGVLASGAAPTGTIAFSAFGPDNATCTGTPVFTSTVTVSGNGTYGSASFTATAPGVYNFTAFYSGDTNNAAVETACGDPNESVVVSQRSSPTLATAASEPTQLGGTISDTAVLTGGNAPTGTITFSAFGPNSPSCLGAPVFSSTVAVSSGNGSYTSAPFTPTAAGTYTFVASYSGDAFNDPAANACTSPNETTSVSQAVPTVVTSASAAVTVGGTISDSAVLAGGFTPTGTITFNAYGPNSANCTGAPAFTSTTTVNGNATYSSATFTTTAAGTYNFVASYSGDANNNAVTSACGAANESVVVIPKASPSLVTTASAPVTVGNTISDSAVLAGGASPTGTLVLTAFGPNNANCTGTPNFTATVTVSGNGSYSSGPFTPSATGTYNFVATYSGDANNNAVTSACGTTNESTVVSRANPSVVTRAWGSVTVGGTISDSAELAGGFNPTGSIAFYAYGPNDTTCTGVPSFTSTTMVSGNGRYGSATFTTTAAGTYNFVARYSGDATNNAVTSVCGTTNESAVVSRATPTVVTRASAAVTVGGTISDTAVLASGFNPIGTVAFNAYGPNDATCSGLPSYTSTTSVSGNGTYSSATFTTTAAGTYNFIASYSGDANNNAVTGACGSPNESATVSQATPTLVTAASPSVTLGGSISDSAVLAGGVGPTGTITFMLFGPNIPTCAGTPVFSSTVAVIGNGTYSSAAFAPTAAGTYNFAAAYSGDANNAAAASSCGAPRETTTVTGTTTTLTTRATPFAIAGGRIFDIATLAGGRAPTGTITFTVFGPTNTTCSGSPMFTSTKTVNGSGSYASDGFRTIAAGTYRWVASYSGDVNNSAAMNTCNDPAEISLVTSRCEREGREGDDEDRNSQGGHGDCEDSQHGHGDRERAE